jgi:hypothetical protein
MSSEVDTRVTPTLHPDNIKSVDGYDETTAPYLGPVETAFSEAYLGIGLVHTARDKARSNPTWNEAQQVIQTQDLADKVFARIARHFDGAKANLDKGIAFIEGELAAPVTAKAAASVAAEIRTYAKVLETGERMSFVQRAIADGDETTVSSLLGAPPYLSGLTREMQAILTRQWHERNSPQLAQRLMDDAPAIARVVIDAALEGDMQAASLVLARIAPTLRSQTQPVTFDFDASAPIARQVEQVLEGIASGAVPADIGKQIIDAIGALSAVRATEELEARLAALEAKEGR